MTRILAKEVPSAHQDTEPSVGHLSKLGKKIYIYRISIEPIDGFL